MNLSEKEIHLVRQWFDALQDLNESFLKKEDYELAVKIYQACGWRVPNSIKAEVE